tara:strand:+ start:49 stop:3120 length:3072 start_codon:yes stop_codon:yes gene_type:complete
MASGWAGIGLGSFGAGVAKSLEPENVMKISNMMDMFTEKNISKEEQEKAQKRLIEKRKQFALNAFNAQDTIVQPETYNAEGFFPDSETALSPSVVKRKSLEDFEKEYSDFGERPYASQIDANQEIANRLMARGLSTKANQYIQQNAALKAMQNSADTELLGQAIVTSSQTGDVTAFRNAMGRIAPKLLPIVEGAEFVSRLDPITGTKQDGLQLKDGNFIAHERLLALTTDNLTYFQKIFESQGTKAAQSLLNNFGAGGGGSKKIFYASSVNGQQVDLSQNFLNAIMRSTNAVANLPGYEKIKEQLTKDPNYIPESKVGKQKNDNVLSDHKDITFSAITEIGRNEVTSMVQALFPNLDINNPQQQKQVYQFLNNMGPGQAITELIATNGAAAQQMLRGLTVHEGLALTAEEKAKYTSVIPGDDKTPERRVWDIFAIGAKDLMNRMRNPELYSPVDRDNKPKDEIIQFGGVSDNTTEEGKAKNASLFRKLVTYYRNDKSPDPIGQAQDAYQYLQQHADTIKAAGDPPPSNNAGGPTPNALTPADINLLNDYGMNSNLARTPATTAVPGTVGIGTPSTTTVATPATTATPTPSKLIPDNDISAPPKTQQQILLEKYDGQVDAKKPNIVNLTDGLSVDTLTGSVWIPKLKLWFNIEGSGKDLKLIANNDPEFKGFNVNTIQTSTQRNLYKSYNSTYDNANFKEEIVKKAGLKVWNLLSEIKGLGVANDSFDLIAVEKDLAKAGLANINSSTTLLYNPKTGIPDADAPQKLKTTTQGQQVLVTEAQTRAATQNAYVQEFDTLNPGQPAVGKAVVNNISLETNFSKKALTSNLGDAGTAIGAFQFQQKRLEQLINMAINEKNPSLTGEERKQLNTALQSIGASVGLTKMNQSQIDLNARNVKIISDIANKYDLLTPDIQAKYIHWELNNAKIGEAWIRQSDKERFIQLSKEYGSLNTPEAEFRISTSLIPFIRPALTYERLLNLAKKSGVTDPNLIEEVAVSLGYSQQKDDATKARQARQRQKLGIGVK